MSKLTRETAPENLIRFVSHAGRYDLEQKLGAIEHSAERMIEEICDRRCRFRDLEQEELDDKCRECPVTKLADMIGI